MKLDSGLSYLRDYIVNFSSLKTRSVIAQSDRVLTEIHHRVEDEILIFVKSITLSRIVGKFEIKQKIATLINLRHPCISGLIGFVFPNEFSESRELQIVGLYAEYGSLAEVISASPLWWTATMKAKTVVGIVLGLRYAHSFGLLHGGLTTKNIHFDSDHHIQITDFGLIGLKIWGNEGLVHIGGLSDEGWTPKIDICGFVSIFLEIVVGPSAQYETSIPSDVPEFVSDIIKSRLWSESESERNRSFLDIFNILRRNDFQILDGVDSTEVSTFVSWVELSERDEN
jgi:serine/threonine protein kinase